MRWIAVAIFLFVANVIILSFFGHVSLLPEIEISFTGVAGLYAFFTLSGITVTFWALVGLLRFFTERLTHIGKKILQVRPRKQEILVQDVAVIVPAHNEELTIARTIASVLHLVEPHQVHIGSDASTDRTVEICRKYGCNVADIFPNKGKAGVLKHLIDHFELSKKYKAVMIVDADTEIDKNYLKHALPFFNDPDICAVAGHAIPHWKKHFWPEWQMIIVAYRVRLYRMLQAVMRYGQTWKYTNVSAIIPGFCSIYRSSILPSIDITAPGLIIEDFNMTFEVHHKKLGKIAYTPKCFGISNEPTNFKDYSKQVKRWNLGFWQTVRKHGFWPSLFWLSTAIFQIEMIVVCIFFLPVPFFFLVFLLTGFQPIHIEFPDFLPYVIDVRFQDLFLGVFLMDYLLTVVIAFVENKPSLLLYGLTFFFLRFVDVVLYLYSIPLAFFVKSTGRWVSPKRKVLD